MKPFCLVFLSTALMLIPVSVTPGALNHSGQRRNRHAD